MVKERTSKNVVPMSVMRQVKQPKEKPIEHWVDVHLKEFVVMESSFLLGGSETVVHSC